MEPHTFEPKDPIEVITPHGLGIVVYVTVYGPHANDLWCIATKSDGQLRHYQTIQIQLAESGVIGMNEKPKVDSGILTNEKSREVMGDAYRRVLNEEKPARQSIADYYKNIPMADQPKEDPNRVDCFHKLPPNASSDDYQELFTCLGPIFIKKSNFK